MLVNRLAYDLKLPLTEVSLLRLGEPQRGDIVTFSSPRDGTRLMMSRNYRDKMDERLR